MRKGLWSALPTKKRQIEVKTGGGLHTGLPPSEIPDGFCADMKNLHSCTYPHLSPRPPRDTAEIPHLPQGEVRFFGVIFGTTLAAVVGNTLYTLSADVWTNRGTLFNSTTGRVYHADFMDWAVFADGTACKKYNGKSITAVGTKGSPEHAKFMATHAWHLFTASDKDKMLRYSAVENIDDWSAPGDAGQDLVETTKEAYAGGLCAYGGHILYFKENALFELYGTDPVNFSLLCLSQDIGCISQASIVEIGGILYFLGRDGVYRYAGGTNPSKICFPIRKFIENMDYERKEEITGGTDGTRYYLFLPQKDGEDAVLTFDTVCGEWYREDNTPFIGFAFLDGKTYAADTSGTVYVFGQGDELVEWERTSGPYYFENSIVQNWHRMYIRAEVEEGASFQVLLSPWAGGEGFTLVGSFTESGQAVIQIPRKLRNAPHMRIRLSGQGQVTVSAIEFELRGVRRSYI